MSDHLSAPRLELLVLWEKNRKVWKYLIKPFFKRNKTKTKQAEGKPFQCELRLILWSLTLDLNTVFVQQRLHLMPCGISEYLGITICLCCCLFFVKLQQKSLGFNIRIQNFMGRWQSGRVWASFTLLLSWYRLRSSYWQGRTVGLNGVGICRIVFLFSLLVSPLAWRQG